MHQTDAWDRFYHGIHEFKWTLWVIIHGIFKAIGLGHLGEDNILRLVIAMAVTPLILFVLILFNESRELRKNKAKVKKD